MERIKRLFQNSTNQQRQRRNKSGQTTTSAQTKKKRFSVLILKSAIDPNHEEQTKSPSIKNIPQSTSFLQLQSLASTNGAMRRSRSVLGQLASFKKAAVVDNEQGADTINSSDSVYQDYFNNALESDIIHTAAVSISSAYNTVNNNKMFLAYGGGGGNHRKSNLQLGIEFYEKGELDDATHYWRLATEENEIVAVFFYGLALRHGWGCRKSPAIALRYLQKTTNKFTPLELESALTRLVNPAKLESLVCSIYELGEFFWHGWEVPKSVTMATWYFQIAANMGNPHAMNDLGFCFKYGHGVSKDNHQAARLYRQAAEHGFVVENNAWIWDPMYDGIQEE